MKTPRYVVASCKPWHGDEFERIRQREHGDWHFVTNPEELEETVARSEPRYIFFLHWSWIVPKEIWSRHECVCFHMTDVPFGRGGSPLQNLIARGLKETKVSALRMVEEVDAGPVYRKSPMTLEGKAEDIYRRAGKLSCEMIPWLIETQPKPVPQEGEVLLFKRRKPEQSELPSEGSLEGVYDHIRMLDAPTYPLAFIEHGDFRLEFADAEVKGEEIRARVVFRRSFKDKGHS